MRRLLQRLFTSGSGTQAVFCATFDAETEAQFDLKMTQRYGTSA